MPTIEERKFELKQKRSDALMAKINVLRARDGSVAPPIDSMKEEDSFNLGLLFGSSKSENISWSAMGVEGLIRCFYEIQYKLTGKVRNNIIKVGSTSGSPDASHNSSCRSGLTSAVKWLADGQGYKSGFYIGWAGLDNEANDEGNAIKKQKLNSALSMGRKGDLDVPMTKDWSSLASELNKPDVSTSFTTNRDKYTYWDSNAQEMVTKYPDDHRSSSLLGKFDDLIAVIGFESPKGPYVETVKWGKSPTPWTSVVNDTLLGYRHRDVCPYNYNPPSSYTSNIIDSNGNSSYITTYTDGHVTYGDGNWDVSAQASHPPDFIPTPDYWTTAYDQKAQAIINTLNDTINYINFTKIVNFTYFVNHLIIPGIDLNYDPADPNSVLGSSWNLQNGWISQLTDIKDRIQYSLDFINTRKVSSSATHPSYRAEVDNEIFQMLALLQGWVGTVTSLNSTIDGVYGSITDPLTLYGHRFMWIRTLIHASEGSMTAVNASGIAIEMMEKKLVKSEDELLMFGLLQDKWIPTPIIVGIEPYPVLNQVTFEMEIGGWLVAWGGQEHCVGYDVWKSVDYDPATKQGTWTKIEVSNTQYTMTDINANNGKVLTYIIDSDVEPITSDTDQSEITHPYYKVKAYDINGGSGDYDRKDAESEICEPMNPAAFPLSGSGSDTSGPRRTPVTTVDANGVGARITIPPNTLFWVTSFTGVEAADFERRTFISEAPYDSTASNLIVFVDGKFKNLGPQESGGDYELIDTYKIRFYESIQRESEVNLVVALRSFAKNDTVKGVVDFFEELPFPPDVKHGDIYFVENPEPGSYWQWLDPPGEWRQIADPNSGSVWRNPVNTLTQLPTQLNTDGDVRLVLDNSTLYRWDGTNEIWVKISGAAGGGWLSPVDTTDDMDEIDTATLSNGAIIFVIAEESLYRWSTTQQKWLQIAGSNAINWKEPVNTITQLPTSGNSEGDIRLVLDENKMYRWFSWEQTWKVAKAEADMAHTELNDEDWEVVDDHDVRYYPRADIDETYNDIKQRLQLLESLKPKNAEPLSGDFSITGTKLYEGYLSESVSVLNYDTLNPGDFFRRILKDASFILSNRNTQQFKDADKGILYCYINDDKVDEFNLGEWFNEEERETGQTYPRQFGINNIIEILSVGPYNQYATYQRADFQLNIKENLLIQGENKIRLEHEVGNLTEDINVTEDFIIFWDEFDGSMGFKEIYVEEVELNSNKYLSGVRYYSLGDRMKLKFEAENVFNNTYVKDKQIYVYTENFGITPFYTNYEDENMLGQPIPQLGENLFYINEFNLTVDGIYSSQPELRLEATNPFGTYKQIKNNTNMLINTVIGSSTDLREDFVDEVYRLPIADYDNIPSIYNQWDSTQPLGLKDLLVFNNSLVYPETNFTKYKPINTVNYSTASGARSYIRAFKDSNPHNNGKLVIDGFYNADPNIKVEIKLPGLTGWMSLNNKYNVADFTGADDDGCLVSNKTINYEWTSGEFSTANSNYIVLIKITMYQSTNSISSIRMEW